MNISEVIGILRQAKVKHGDLEVHVYDEWDDFPLDLIVFDDGKEMDGTFFRQPRIVIQSSNNKAYGQDKAIT